MDTAAALTQVSRRRRTLERARQRVKTASELLENEITAAYASGATQREIAERANVSQPYIAQVLASRKRRFVPTSRLGELLASKRGEVYRIVRSYGADNVIVFGSVATGTDGPDSDIDLMVDIPAGMGLFDLAAMELDVSEALGVDVDVVPSRLVKPAVQATADTVAVPL